mmetsp:Transcript_18773/g.57748  ORF Transcript_18773/g.57748 Transcript_18773/m.57748 type:complete len:249 (+) Transcript_18773:1113-1859(+)
MPPSGDGGNVVVGAGGGAFELGRAGGVVQRKSQLQARERRRRIPSPPRPLRGPRRAAVRVAHEAGLFDVRVHDRAGRLDEGERVPGDRAYHLGAQGRLDRLRPHRTGPDALHHRRHVDPVPRRQALGRFQAHGTLHSGRTGSRRAFSLRQLPAPPLRREQLSVETPRPLRRLLRPRPSHRPRPPRRVLRQRNRPRRPPPRRLQERRRQGQPLPHRPRRRPPRSPPLFFLSLVGDLPEIFCLLRRLPSV